MDVSKEREGLVVGGPRPFISIQGVLHSILPGFMCIISGPTWEVCRTEGFISETLNQRNLVHFNFHFPGDQRKMIFTFLDRERIQITTYFSTKEEVAGMTDEAFRRMTEVINSDDEFQERLEDINYITCDGPGETEPVR